MLLQKYIVKCVWYIQTQAVLLALSMHSATYSEVFISLTVLSVSRALDFHGGRNGAWVKKLRKMSQQAAG